MHSLRDLKISLTKKYEKSDALDNKIRPWLTGAAVALLAFALWRHLSVGPLRDQPLFFLAATFGAVILVYVVADFFHTRKPISARVDAAIGGRHRSVRGTATNEVRKKLIQRLRAEQDLELLADDLMQIIAAESNHPSGFIAASRELDRLAMFDTDLS